MDIIKFQWKDTSNGTKAAVYLDNNKWFYLPQRMSKTLLNVDPYLTMMNGKSWTIVFKGRATPNGLAIFDLKYKELE